VAIPRALSELQRAADRIVQVSEREIVIMCGSNIDDELHTRATQHPESFPD
jgi:hypothetical protein